LTVFWSRALKRETNVFFHVIGKLLTKHVFGSRKDASVWQREVFHSFIHRFPPPTLGFTNKTMTAKISAKKVGDFYL